jgi:tRNA A37 threonylcarbamoyladenosine synthetase subunit TsaC/SUA5/YrdC
VLIKIHPKNPDERNLQKVIDCLKNGGVIIYQTDTVYAIGCDINQPKAFERICKIKGIKYKLTLYLIYKRFNFLCG